MIVQPRVPQCTSRVPRRWRVASPRPRTPSKYCRSTAARLREDGLEVITHLALGDPPTEIIKTAQSEHCDLIAMTTHGHRLLGDLIYGSTIHEVRHKSSIPILLVRAEKND